ncbi:MAG: CNNM domain-containing protein [Candidatus Omnitrophota bacterium]
MIVLAWFMEAFFSGAETAFISVNILKMMHLIEKKNKYAMAVHNLVKKPDRLLATTLIGTNIAVVVSSACATVLFARWNETYSALWAILVMTPFSFIFCQLLPKAVFRYQANRMAMLVARPMAWSEKIFWPLVSFFTFFAKSVAFLVNPKGLKKNPFLTKDEIKSLIKDISREGILEDRERQAIDKIFDMTVTKAADAMVFLKNVIGISTTESVEDIRAKCRIHRFTRFPVFEGQALKGIINVFDVFYHQPQGDWSVLIRPILQVEGSENLDKVFSKMRPSKESMAAVFQAGQMVGIVTMEDLMEHITLKLMEVQKT